MSNPSRRQFLTGSAAALAAATLGRIGAIQAAVQDSASSADLSRAYSLDGGITYLNHGSIGTIPKAVQTARQGYLQLCETNPWFYMWSGEWEQPLEAVRERAAGLLGCRPLELAFTHNTTEAFNLFAQGLPLQPRDEVLFSNLNHAGASVCFEHQAGRGRYRVRRFDLPLEQLSGISLDEVIQRHADQIRPETRVLALPHVDNMLGLRHPLKALTQMARDRGVEFILVDAAQTVGMLPIDVVDAGVDGFAASPHKWLQAPKGLGLTYVRESLLDSLKPMWVTWGQKRWPGSARIYEDYGTRNLPEVLALGDAIAFQQQLGAERKLTHYQNLWQHAQQRVAVQPGLEWASPRDWSLSASLFAIRLKSGKASEVAQELFSGHGIVLRPFDNPGLNTLRVSPNLANSLADIDRLVDALSR